MTLKTAKHKLSNLRHKRRKVKKNPVNFVKNYKLIFKTYMKMQII